MSTEEELLRRYSPFIQYDSMESYSADSVATMTDCATPRNPRGNVLKHAGKELAAVAPPAGEAKLDLAFLHPGHYPDPVHTEVAAEDFIDVVGKEYIAEAHAMHLRPGMPDQIYGHPVTDRSGGLWLQYWFFYYFNDKAMLWMGLHEGDWEMVQLRIGADGAPDVATYAQHRRGGWCEWRDVEKEDGAPIVYSARGSHASYFRPGVHVTETLVVSDYNDAGGPLVRPQLNLIADEVPTWVAWPGRWGSTREQGKIFGILPIGDNGPPGPRRHGQWRDPLKFHEEALPAVDLSPRVGTELKRLPAPQVQAARDGSHATVSFSFPVEDPASPPLKGVLVSLDGAKDKHAPVTKLFEPVPADGKVDFPLELEDRAYTVRVSGVGGDNLTGPTGSAVLPATDAGPTPAL
jgi:hypothetical protein